MGIKISFTENGTLRVEADGEIVWIPLSASASRESLPGKIEGDPAHPGGKPSEKPAKPAPIIVGPLPPIVPDAFNVPTGDDNPFDPGRFWRDAVAGGGTVGKLRVAASNELDLYESVRKHVAKQTPDEQVLSVYFRRGGAGPISVAPLMELVRSDSNTLKAICLLEEDDDAEGSES